MGAGSDRRAHKGAEGAEEMSGAALTIEMLRRGGDALGPAEWQQVKARCAWVTRQVAAWDEAMRAMGERCMAAVETMSEEAFDRLCDEEEAKVAAIRAPLNAVIERDEWPRELHWGGI